MQRNQPGKKEKKAGRTEIMDRAFQMLALFPRDGKVRLFGVQQDHSASNLFHVEDPDEKTTHLGTLVLFHYLSPRVISRES